MHNESLLTVRQVAAQIDCSIRTVHRLVDSGSLTPAIKLPGSTGAYLFRPADVAALQQTRKAA